MKIKKKEINKIVSNIVWRYCNGENRCNGCGVWGWSGKPHDDDCEYGQLLKIVKKGIEDEDANI